LGKDPSDLKHEYFQTSHLQANLAGRSIRGGAVTSLSQGIRFFAGIAATAVFGRLLTPEDYGLIGMVVVVAGFVSLFKDLGLSNAAIQEQEINPSQISTLFWLNLMVSILVMLVTALLGPAIAWFYGDRRLILITAVYAVGFLFGGLTTQHEALLRRQMRFMALAVIDIVSLAVGVITGVILALSGAGYWALVTNQLVFALANAAGVWIVCRWRPGPPGRLSAVRSMLIFGRNLTAFTIVNYFARNLDNMLIGKFWGSQQLGFYAKAYQLLLLPIDQVNSPIAAVAVPALSRLKDSPERYRDAYLRILEKVGMLTMPGMALLIATSDWVVRILLGDQWSSTARIFAVLGLAGIFQPITNSTGWLFISQGRTDRMFRWGLLGSSIILIGIVAGLPWGALGVAVSYTAAFLVTTPLLFWFVGREGPVRAGDFYRTIAPTTIAALFVLIGVVMFRHMVPVSNAVNGLLISSAIAASITLLIFAIIPAGRSALFDLKRSVVLLLARDVKRT
jgi:PST family polysaccharide transporter